MRGWNVVISDGRDFLITPLNWGSGGVVYTPNVIKIGAGIQKLIGGIHMQTHRQQGDLIGLLLFFSK
jgi:hypothetical protein